MFQIVSIFVGVVVLTSLSLYALWRQDVVGALPLSVVMAFGALWQFSLGMLNSSVTPEAALIWYRIQFIGVAGLPVALLLFVAKFYGIDKWITFRNVALLSIVPLATQYFV